MSFCYWVTSPKHTRSTAMLFFLSFLPKIFRVSTSSPTVDPIKQTILCFWVSLDLCLRARAPTWRACVKWSSPWTLQPKRKELALIESDVMVQRISTCLPPMSPRPTEDCMLASSLAWIRSEAASTWASHLVGR